MYALVEGLVGASQVNLIGIGPDAAENVAMGTIVQAVDPWWGGGEFIYARANGSIRTMGLCVITPVFDSTTSQYFFNVTEVTNTTIMGRPACVAMSAMSSGQFGWFQIGGLTPVDCTASVAADTTFAIAAAGQGGALAAGKQVVNARIVVAAAATVSKVGASGPSGGTYIDVGNTDGLFPGVFLSGTGVGALARVTSIDSSQRRITVSVVNSALVSGTLLATYNNATIFYNVAHLNRPFYQGAIT